MIGDNKWAGSRARSSMLSDGVIGRGGPEVATLSGSSRRAARDAAAMG